MALGQSLVTEVDGHVVMFKVVTKWVVLPITNYQLPNGPIKAGRRWGQRHPQGANYAHISMSPSNPASTYNSSKMEQNAIRHLTPTLPPHA